MQLRQPKNTNEVTQVFLHMSLGLLFHSGGCMSKSSDVGLLSSLAS